MTKFTETLSEIKQTSYIFYTERFNLKNLKVVRVKRGIALRSQTSLNLCKIQILKWKLIVLGRRLGNPGSYELMKISHGLE
jgi:hypothetical protein